MDENEVPKALEAKGLGTTYDRVVEQLASMDQKAQSMIGLEGLLLALMAVFSSTIPSDRSVRVAAWAAMVILLASALSSLMVLRIRYGSSIIAHSGSIEEGMVKFRAWRDHKLRLHRVALFLLALGLLGLVVVLSLILL